MKRWRTLIGAIGIPVFLAAYIWAAMMIGVRLPANNLIRLIYYVVAGTAWGAPLFPLMSWMARDDKS